jgi:hypothetical protein
LLTVYFIAHINSKILLETLFPDFKTEIFYPENVLRKPFMTAFQKAAYAVKFPLLPVIRLTLEKNDKTKE